MGADVNASEHVDG